MPQSLPLFDWTRRYLPFIQTEAPSPFHHWLCNTLDHINPGERRAVQAARGSAKSSYVSYAYPLREALEGRQQFTLILSDTSTQSKGFLRQIRREVESNELLIRDYPTCQPGEVWRDNWISLANGCEIAAVGSGGKVRGLKSAMNRRPTLILLDDVQRKEHIQSALQRERSWEWLTKDVLPAGEPSTRIFVVGTPMHRDDVVCTLERTPTWKVDRWRAIGEWPKRLDLWREYENLLHSYDLDDSDREARADEFFLQHQQEMSDGASLLWESRWPLLELMKKRASIGHAAFEAEYQCNPVDPSSTEWPADYLDHPNLWFDEWPAQLVVKTIALDPSKGRDSKHGDYSAIVKFGRDRFGVEYIEADLARRPVDVQCHELARHCQEFNPDGVAVEVNQFQELMVVPIQDAARKLGVDIPIYKVDNSVPKEVRIRRWTTPLAQRRVRFRTRSPGTQLLLQQARDFPSGAHDDGIDCAEVARRLALELTGGRAVNTHRR